MSPYAYIILGMNNRLVGGCRSQTQSHPASMNIIMMFKFRISTTTLSTGSEASDSDALSVSSLLCNGRAHLQQTGTPKIEQVSFTYNAGVGVAPDTCGILGFFCRGAQTVGCPPEGVNPLRGRNLLV
jgi:hypothetical protein